MNNDDERDYAEESANRRELRDPGQLDLVDPDTGDLVEPCQPIGCDNGYHLPGCVFALVDQGDPDQDDQCGLCGRPGMVECPDCAVSDQVDPEFSGADPGQGDGLDQLDLVDLVALADQVDTGHGDGVDTLKCAVCKARPRRVGASYPACLTCEVCGDQGDAVAPGPGDTRYLVINPAGDLVARSASVPALILDAVRRDIGGYAETISVDQPGLVALVNEDGMSMGLPVNPVGTRVLLDLGWSPAWFPTGGVRGPVALVGSGRRDLVGLTPDQVELVRDTCRTVAGNPPA